MFIIENEKQKKRKFLLSRTLSHTHYLYLALKLDGRYFMVFQSLLPSIELCIDLSLVPNAKRSLSVAMHLSPRRHTLYQRTALELTLPSMDVRLCRTLYITISGA